MNALAKLADQDKPRSGNTEANHTLPNSNSFAKSPRDGKSALLAAEGTYSNHTFARRAADMAWKKWAIRLHSPSLDLKTERKLS